MTQLHLPDNVFIEGGIRFTYGTAMCSRRLLEVMCEDRGIDLQQLSSALGDKEAYSWREVKGFINDWCEEHDIF